LKWGKGGRWKKEWADNRWIHGKTCFNNLTPRLIPDKKATKRANPANGGYWCGQGGRGKGDQGKNLGVSEHRSHGSGGISPPLKGEGWEREKVIRKGGKVGGKGQDHPIAIFGGRDESSWECTEAEEKGNRPEGRY